MSRRARQGRRADEFAALPVSEWHDTCAGGDVARYALIHGAGDVGWYWHLVEGELRRRGHTTVAPDLPIEDDEATLSDHAAVVLDAIGPIGGEGELVIVGQSYGGYVAPIVAERAAADLLVLVAAMIPQPGESADEMWEATGWRMPPGDTIAVFYHDVDPALAAVAMAHERRQSSATSGDPWPLNAWPDVETRFILCRDDRFFTAGWLRQVVRDRLGVEPDELDSGHTPALSHPVQLVDMLESFRRTKEEPDADR
jgi:pimeloyl-ACP methyl ester carboxylesterase